MILFSGLFILFFSYIGYGILLWMLIKIKTDIFGTGKALTSFHTARCAGDRRLQRGRLYPSEDREYPGAELSPGLLDIIFITDGSTDGTPDIVQEYPAVRLMHEPARLGKTAALNRAMDTVTAPLLSSATPIPF